MNCCLGSSQRLPKQYKGYCRCSCLTTRTRYSTFLNPYRWRQHPLWTQNTERWSWNWAGLFLPAALTHSDGTWYLGCQRRKVINSQVQLWTLRVFVINCLARYAHWFNIGVDVLRETTTSWLDWGPTPLDGIYAYHYRSSQKLMARSSQSSQWTCSWCFVKCLPDIYVYSHRLTRLSASIFYSPSGTHDWSK